MKRVINLLVIVGIAVFAFYYYYKRDKKETVIVNDIKRIVITVNNSDLIVELENNTSAIEFYKRLEKESLTLKASDYGNFEKVADLGFELPRNDESFETVAGDLILYQGNKITLYYDKNRYKFTKLGHVTNKNSYELKELLGSGDVTLKFSIKK